jgi:hypothetical protein
MTSSEFRRARAILGLSDDSLAAELAVTPAVIRAWDAGATAIPKRYGQHLTWLAARAERDAALSVSGLPVCAWMTSRPQPRPDAKSAEIAAELSLLADHARACPVCLARDRYVAERFGPMPEPPAPAWTRVAAWVAQLPPWARPPVLGAAFIGALVALRLIFALPALAAHPGRLAEAFGALLVAASAGAFGGLAFSLTRPSFLRLGRIGDYLSGVVCVSAYACALVLVAPYAFGDPIVTKPVHWMGVAVVALVFGLVIGHSWLRPTTASERGTTAP